MKHLIAVGLAAALLSGGCAARTAPAEVTAAGPAASCSVTVTFGSYAAGIDRGVYETVVAMLAHDAGVSKTEEMHWGREGEVTLCVRTKTRGDAARLFGKIKALFPARPRGPLTVDTAAGSRFEAGATP